MTSHITTLRVVDVGVVVVNRFKVRAPGGPFALCEKPCDISHMAVWSL